MDTNTTKRRLAIRLVALALLAAPALLVAACNTTEGFGKDVQSAGEGIQGAAEGAK